MAQQFLHTHCPICQSTELSTFKSDHYFFPTYSKTPEFFTYQLVLCQNCTVIFMDSFPDEEKLVHYYNSEYRGSKYAINLKSKSVEPPIMIPWSGVSFLRFRNFYQTLEKHVPSVKLSKEDTVVDYGGYQGMWGYALKQAYNCEPIIYDYNASGIDFAKKTFGFTKSVVAKDIYTETFPSKIRLAALIQTFEHLNYPIKFLNHLRENILQENGYIYIEVPNAYAFAHCDPTHAFTYNMHSLERTLNICGFEVLHIREEGFPKLDIGIDNDRLCIVCLAQAAPKGKKITPKTQKPENLKKKILQNYTKESFKILLRRYKEAIVFILKTIILTVLVIVSPLIGYKKLFDLKNRKNKNKR